MKIIGHRPCVVIVESIKMSWEKILKSQIGDGGFMFHVTAKVLTEDEDGEEVAMDERELHRLAESVLQQMLRETFSSEFENDDGTTFEVDCEIISVSENR